MKKIYLILFSLFCSFLISSCSHDDDLFSNYNRDKKYTYTLEITSNSDTEPIYYGSIILKKYYKETIESSSKTISRSAICKDPEVLMTLKLYDKKGKLLREVSRNNYVSIEYTR